MQTLDSAVAAAQTADRHAAARSSRAARRAAPRPVADGLRLVLRRSVGGGRAGARPPRPPRQRPAPDAAQMLVAEVDEQIVAAVPLDGGRAIADPFRPTADIVELLQARAELARPRAPRPRPRSRLRLPRVRVA